MVFLGDIQVNTLYKGDKDDDDDDNNNNNKFEENYRAENNIMKNKTITRKKFKK